MHQESRAITAERAFSRYSVIAAFGLSFLGLAASLGSNASVLTLGRHNLGIEIPAAGDFDQQLAQKYFLLPTNQIDSDAAAPAPETDQADITPESPAEGPPESPIEQIVEIQKGDTLMSVLTDAGIKRTEAHAAIVALSDVFSPRQLMPGQPIKLTLAPNVLDGARKDGTPRPNLQLVSLSLQPSVTRNVEITRGLDGAFTAQSTDVPLHREMARAAGIIQSSLFEAGQASGVPIEVMTEVIRAFSYDVDFQREIQPGDKFEVLYERFADSGGHLAKTGNVAFASLTLSGRELKLYNYTLPDGQVDWFNQKGDSVRKALLRTPVDGAKITSGFGMRVNPILGYSMMHKGIDFGAPIGTPIYAAGDGVIQMIGPASGYGNYIRIKHTSQYSTAYGHMSRYAAGLHVGSRVHQGQIIAYVGMSGRATGPHLHYEVLVNGQQINPKSIKLPTGEKLQGKDLRVFLALVANIDRQRRDLIQSGVVATAR